MRDDMLDTLRYTVETHNFIKREKKMNLIDALTLFGPYKEFTCGYWGADDRTNPRVFYTDGRFIFIDDNHPKSEAITPVNYEIFTRNDWRLYIPKPELRITKADENKLCVLRNHKLALIQYVHEDRDEETFAVRIIYLREKDDGIDHVRYNGRSRNDVESPYDVVKISKHHIPTVSLFD